MLSFLWSCISPKLHSLLSTPELPLHSSIKGAIQCLQNASAPPSAVAQECHTAPPCWC